jgi:hypothetical protein
MCSIRRDAIQITSKTKGGFVAVSVVLDLCQAVSGQDLRHFLSYLPEAHGPAEDLRSDINSDGTTHFLEIPIPLPEEGNRDYH